MLDLDAVDRGLMRDVGAVLRPMGFRGSGGVWRLVTADGVAVVQKQGSGGSAWDAKLFYVNTAVVPRAWWSGGSRITALAAARSIRRETPTESGSSKAGSSALIPATRYGTKPTGGA
jgi:hypothetical protein